MQPISTSVGDAPVMFRTSGNMRETGYGGYTPIIGSRTTLVNRTSLADYVPITSATSGTTNRRSQRVSVPLSMASGAVMQASNASVASFKEHRDKEKRELGTLNDRLASFIEKARFLEAQNNTLKTEVEHLTRDKGNEVVKLKEMFVGELSEARALIDDLTAQKAEADVKDLRIEDQLATAKREHENDVALLEEWKKNYNDLAKKVRGYEAEISELSTRSKAQELDLKSEREKMRRLQQDNERLRRDLDGETLSHINMANRVQSLEEEMEFMGSIYDQEMKELKAIGQRDVTAELKDYWKGELSKALSEIQKEQERKVEHIRLELENSYSQQLREIRQGACKDSVDGDHAKEETKRLRNKVLQLTSKLTDIESKNAQLESQNKDMLKQLEDKNLDYETHVVRISDDNTKVRGELEAVNEELKQISDAKLNLELELTTYKALLDEEDRRSPKPIVDQEMQVTQSTGRVTLQRSSRGPICFTDVAPDGRHIAVENSGSGKMAKIINLMGWKIERVMAGTKSAISFVFPDITLAPGETVKVWAKGAETKMKAPGGGDLSSDVFSWGTGNSTTHLYDAENHEKASAVLKFVI